MSDASTQMSQYFTSFYIGILLLSGLFPIQVVTMAEAQGSPNKLTSRVTHELFPLRQKGLNQSQRGKFKDDSGKSFCTGIFVITIQVLN